jgi:hypothetical protein
MDVKSVSKVVSPQFIANLAGVRSGSSSDSTPATFSGSNLRTAASGISEGFGFLNVGIDFLNLTSDTLDSLTKIVEEVIDVAKRASKSSTPQSSRIKLNERFSELALEFTRTVEDAVSEDRNVLNEEDISEVLEQLGISSETSQALGAAIKKFAYPKAENGDLASDKLIGRRPVKPVVEERIVTTYTSNGTLLGEGSYSVGATGSVPQIADFSGDGNLDVLVPGSTGTSFYKLFRGNGDGSFVAPITISTGGLTPMWVESADYNNDGELDLMAVDNPAGVIFQMSGNGDGTFSSAVSIATGAVQFFKTADLNGDNNLDLILTRPTGIAIWTGDGTGTFTAGQTFSTGGVRAGDLSVVDVDGDGSLDIVSPTYDNDQIYLFRGNGDGSFNTAAWSNLTVGATPNTRLETADLNGDNNVDIVSVSTTDGVARVMLGNGDGTFGAATSFGITGGNAQDVAIADVTGDGEFDLIVGSGSVINVLQGDGSGSFSASVTYTATGATNIENVRIADFNKDGFNDVVVGESGGTWRIRLQSTTASETVETYDWKKPTPVSSVFPTGRNILSRGDALAVINDAEELLKNLKSNKRQVGEVKKIVEQNIELVRATGLGLLELSNQIKTDVDAETVSRMLQSEIRARGRGALSEIGTLPSVLGKIVVA